MNTTRYNKSLSKYIEKTALVDKYVDDYFEFIAGKHDIKIKISLTIDKDIFEHEIDFPRLCLKDNIKVSKKIKELCEFIKDTIIYERFE